MSPLSDAQRAIVNDLGRSLCVTSGAGCGKTSVLVERYIRFLDEDLALGLERLAAITFTENAAAEMRQRIRQACRSRMVDARRRGDTRAQAVWRDRYWGVDVASIDTIHAFCGGLLRRYAIEAGVDPHFALMDEAEATLLADDLVRRTVEELLDADDADLLAVLEHYSLAEARDLLADVLKERREVLQRVAAPVMDRSDAEILRRPRAGRGGIRLGGPAPVAGLAGGGPGRGDSGTEFRQAGRQDRNLAGRGGRNPGAPRAGRGRASLALAAAQELTAAIDLRGGSAKAWPSADALAAVKAALKTLRDSCKDVLKDLVAYDDQTERRHLALARAFYRTARRVIAAYQAAKAEVSAFDFEDLQIRARDLLRQRAARPG